MRARAANPANPVLCVARPGLSGTRSVRQRRSEATGRREPGGRSRSAGPRPPFLPRVAGRAECPGTGARRLSLQPPPRRAGPASLTAHALGRSALSPAPLREAPPPSPPPAQFFGVLRSDSPKGRSRGRAHSGPCPESRKLLPYAPPIERIVRPRPPAQAVLSYAALGSALLRVRFSPRKPRPAAPPRSPRPRPAPIPQTPEARRRTHSPSHNPAPKP